MLFALQWGSQKTRGFTIARQTMAAFLGSLVIFISMPLMANPNQCLGTLQDGLSEGEFPPGYRITPEIAAVLSQSPYQKKFLRLKRAVQFFETIGRPTLEDLNELSHDLVYLEIAKIPRDRLIPLIREGVTHVGSEGELVLPDIIESQGSGEARAGKWEGYLYSSLEEAPDNVIARIFLLHENVDLKDMTREQVFILAELMSGVNPSCGEYQLQHTMSFFFDTTAVAKMTSRAGHFSKNSLRKIHPKTIFSFLSEPVKERWRRFSAEEERMAIKREGLDETSLNKGDTRELRVAKQMRRAFIEKLGRLMRFETTQDLRKHQRNILNDLLTLILRIYLFRTSPEGYEIDGPSHFSIAYPAPDIQEYLDEVLVDGTPSEIRNYLVQAFEYMLYKKTWAPPDELFESNLRNQLVAYASELRSLAKDFIRLQEQSNTAAPGSGARTYTKPQNGKSERQFHFRSKKRDQHKLEQALSEGTVIDSLLNANENDPAFKQRLGGAAPQQSLLDNLDGKLNPDQIYSFRFKTPRTGYEGFQFLRLNSKIIKKITDAKTQIPVDKFVNAFFKGFARPKGEQGLKYISTPSGYKSYWEVKIIKSAYRIKVSYDEQESLWIMEEIEHEDKLNFIDTKKKP